MIACGRFVGFVELEYFQIIEERQLTYSAETITISNQKNFEIRLIKLGNAKQAQR